MIKLLRVDDEAMMCNHCLSRDDIAKMVVPLSGNDKNTWSMFFCPTCLRQLQDQIKKFLVETSFLNRSK